MSRTRIGLIQHLATDKLFISYKSDFFNMLIIELASGTESDMKFILVQFYAQLWVKNGTRVSHFNLSIQVPGDKCIHFERSR